MCDRLVAFPAAMVFATSSFYPGLPPPVTTLATIHNGTTEAVGGLDGEAA